MPRMWLPAYVQGLQTANDVAGFPGWFGDELQTRKSAQRCLEQNLRFESRQCGAEAEVYARAKTQVGIGIAGDIECIGIIECRRIAIGGTKEQP